MLFLENILWYVGKIYTKLLRYVGKIFHNHPKNDIFLWKQTILNSSKLSVVIK